jgi:hypothetical protein
VHALKSIASALRSTLKGVERVTTVSPHSSSRLAP